MLCTCTYVHPHSRGKKGVKRGFNYFIPPKRYFCKQNLFPLRYLLGSKQATQVKRFKFGSHLEFELLTSSTHEMLKMLKEGTKSLVRIEYLFFFFKEKTLELWEKNGGCNKCNRKQEKLECRKHKRFFQQQTPLINQNLEEGEPRNRVECSA